MLDQDEICRRKELINKIEQGGKYPKPKLVTLKKTVEIKKDGKLLTQKDVSDLAIHGAVIAFDIKKGEYAREILQVMFGCEVTIKDNSEAVKRYENLMVVYNHHKKYIPSSDKYEFLTGLTDWDEDGNIIWSSETVGMIRASELHYNEELYEEAVYSELTTCFDPAYEKAARRLTEWANKHDITCCESVIQRDKPSLEAPELVCELLKILGVIK